MSQRIWSPDIVTLGDRIANLTVARAAELSAYLETVHGLRAQVTAVVREVAPDQVIDRKLPAPTQFDVILDGYDFPRKISVIKATRELTGIGLKEAKDLVEAGGHPVKLAVSAEQAQKARAHLEQAGGKVSIRPVAA